MRGDAKGNRVLGREIAKVRKRAGMSQEELAFQAEVHPTYVSQLERGLKSPTVNVLLRLAKALKASGSRLIAVVERNSH